MTDNAQDGKPVTIKSIADALNISFSTVSKALNNNPLIKAETRALVLNKAKEMGYTPNSLARGLRSNSTKTIAIIFNDIENPVLTYVFKHIAIKMADHGYTTMIFDSQFSEKTERNNILSVLSRVPDFIIIEPNTLNPANLKLLEPFAKKVIVQGVKFDQAGYHHVHIDYELGGYLSACELLSNGHRECLVLTEEQVFPASRKFVDGIKKAFAEYNVELDDSRIITSHSSIENGFRIMQGFRDHEKKCWTVPLTAVMTFDDNFAFGIYKSLSVNQLKIPEDLSVVGFDDNPLSSFASPALTTVRLPKEKMAEYHLSILSAALLQNRSEISIYSAEPALIKRGSVKNLMD